MNQVIHKNLLSSISDLKGLGFSVSNLGTIDHLIPSLEDIPEADRLQVARILDSVSRIEDMVKSWKGASDTFWSDVTSWMGEKPPRFNLFKRKEKWEEDRLLKASTLVSDLERFSVEAVAVKSALDAATSAVSFVQEMLGSRGDLSVTLAVMETSLRSAQNACSLLNAKYKAVTSQASFYTQAQKTQASTKIWRS